MSTSLPNRVDLLPDALSQDMEDETVFLCLGSGQFYGLDDVAGRMLQVLDESETVEDAVAVLLARFDVDEARLRSDLAAFIDKLQEAGLVATA